MYSDNNRNAKRFKVLPHRYLQDYEYSIFIDGNMTVVGDVNVLVSKYLNDSITIAKINRIYISPIINDIDSIQSLLKGKKLFKLDTSNNKVKIYNIIDAVDRSFSNKDLEELLEKELSLIEFIYKVYAIRKRNAGELT